VQTSDNKAYNKPKTSRPIILRIIMLLAMSIVYYLCTCTRPWSKT